MNRKYTLTDMLSMMTEAQKTSDYFVVAVNTPSLATPEIIINNPKNLEGKINYYTDAYTENLELKANKLVCIVRYGIISKDNEKALMDIIEPVL